ncbi:hypothetical protein B0H14DRAFT_2615715 [Mycena olivaceomarginata]|nr:hypothetical protein B0H14DRAFT_2615715 [Mycena olivaceomarginata]
MYFLPALVPSSARSQRRRCQAPTFRRRARGCSPSNQPVKPFGELEHVLRVGSNHLLSQIHVGAFFIKSIWSVNPFSTRTLPASSHTYGASFVYTSKKCLFFYFPEARAARKKWQERSSHGIITSFGNPRKFVGASELPCSTRTWNGSVIGWIDSQGERKAQLMGRRDPDAKRWIVLGGIGPPALPYIRVGATSNCSRLYLTSNVERMQCCRYWNKMNPSAVAR